LGVEATPVGMNLWKGCAGTHPPPLFEGFSTFLLSDLSLK